MLVEQMRGEGNRAKISSTENRHSWAAEEQKPRRRLKEGRKLWFTYLDKGERVEKKD